MKKQLKRNVIDAAVAKQESIVSDFRQRIQELLANDGDVNEEKYDNHVQSLKAQAMTEVNLLKSELELVGTELDDLRRQQGIDAPLSARVEPGAVVVTDKKTFFVSASIENFEVDGKKLFGISTKAPIYQKMKGRKRGNTFTHGSTKYVIKDIF